MEDFDMNRRVLNPRLSPILHQVCCVNKTLTCSFNGVESFVSILATYWYPIYIINASVVRARSKFNRKLFLRFWVSKPQAGGRQTIFPRTLLKLCNLTQTKSSNITAILHQIISFIFLYSQVECLLFDAVLCLPNFECWDLIFN